MKLPMHAILLGAAVLSLPRLASAVTVTNTADSGAGSLRAAITTANATSGTTINFNIPTTDANYNATLGVAIIRPTTALPAITADNTTINGPSQTTFLTNPNPNGPEVTLSGELLTSGPGLTIQSSNCIVNGLTINGFTYAGLLIGNVSNPSAATGNVVKGCYIGCNAAGVTALPNEYGIRLESATSTLIGGTASTDRNLISGNETAGVLSYQSPGTLVKGNYIGTDRTGTASLGNNLGVWISTGSSGYATSVIGGTESGARNLLSGNVYTGVAVSLAGPVTVEGNYIGTTPSGNAPLLNGTSYTQDVGIDLGSSYATIGGTVEAARNIIGGHGITGIHVYNGSQISIFGNYVGVGADGATDIGNHLAGIEIFAFASAPVTATIGGVVSGYGNKIAFNGQEGVFVGQESPSSILANVAIRGNSIYSNGLLGIDLVGDSVTANDSGDSDTGPNGLQNFPVLSSAVGSGSGTLISGSLNSTPSSTFNVDFYRSTVPDSSGYGEGRVYLGTQSVTTNASGNGTISFTGPSGIVGQYVTATATRSGLTSEFSGSIAVTTSSFKIAAPSGKGS